MLPPCSGCFLRQRRIRNHWCCVGCWGSRGDFAGMDWFGTQSVPPNAPNGGWEGIDTEKECRMHSHKSHVQHHMPTNLVQHHEVGEPTTHVLSQDFAGLVRRGDLLICYATGLNRQFHVPVVHPFLGEPSSDDRIVQHETQLNGWTLWIYVWAKFFFCADLAGGFKQGRIFPAQIRILRHRLWKLAF